jgi:hypothetical protein
MLGRPLDCGLTHRKCLQLQGTKLCSISKPYTMQVVSIRSGHTLPAASRGWKCHSRACNWNRTPIRCLQGDQVGCKNCCVPGTTVPLRCSPAASVEPPAFRCPCLLPQSRSASCKRTLKESRNSSLLDQTLVASWVAWTRCRLLHMVRFAVYRPRHMLRALLKHPVSGLSLQSMKLCIVMRPGRSACAQPKQTAAPSPLAAAAPPTARSWMWILSC